MDDGSGTINENSNHNAIKITLYDPVSNTMVNENVIFLSILREPRFTFFISTRENGEYQVKPIKPARTNNNSRRISRSQIQRQH